MVKNEENRIKVTLDSIKNHHLFVLDTGSTDKTLEIINNERNKLDSKTFIVTSEFETFDVSRNILLIFAKNILEQKKVKVDYFILLDCNDELIENLSIPLEVDFDGYMVEQQWKTPSIISLWNIRLINAKLDWLYFGKVHEYISQIIYLSKPNFEILYNEKNNIYELKNKNFILDYKVMPFQYPKTKTFSIFQDRTLDGNKSFFRFTKDREILLKEHENNPKDSRTCFYLAQTCSCLGLSLEAQKYYLLRTTLGGYVEEIFQSYLHLGTLSGNIDYFLKALSISLRVEPLVNIANYYISQKEWNLAYIYLKICCDLEKPLENLSLYHDDYDYKRWHLLGIVGYYSKQFEQGRIGCEKAIKTKNLEIDKNNLKYYQ